MNFRGSAFKKSPLSISVPLDGTETVPGLTKLQQRRRLDALEERLGIPRDTAQAVARYKGPYIRELSVDNLGQPARPWPDFLIGSDADNIQAAYSLPSHTYMLLDRLEENLVFFLVNYLTLAAAFGLHIITEVAGNLGCVGITSLQLSECCNKSNQHPWSMGALACMYLSGSCNPPVKKSGSAQLRQQPEQNALPELSLSSLYVPAAYVLFIMSGATGALLRCLPLMLALVLSHAALRRAATEYEAGGAMGVEFGKLWARRGGEVMQHDDPWRLFKEIWVALVEAGIGASGSLWVYAKGRPALAGEGVWPRAWPNGMGPAA